MALSTKVARFGSLGVILLLIVASIPHSVAASAQYAESQAEIGTVTQQMHPLGSNVSEPTVTGIETPSGGAFATVDGTPYFWRSQAERVNVSLSLDASEEYLVCLDSTNATANDTACERVTGSERGPAVVTLVPNATLRPTDAANETANATNDASNATNETVASENPSADAANETAISRDATANATNETVRSRNVTLVTNGTELPTNATIRLKNASDGETLDTASFAIVKKTGDVDGDGISNARERDEGTNLTIPDSDGDGLDDGTEIYEYGTDPTVADMDDDGLSDGEELRTHWTDPRDADTDSDGISDADEVESATHPLVADTDGDGLLDGRERDLGTDPTATDTDGDGVTDRGEVESPTDPLAADTDGDGLLDGVERDGETDVTNADTDGDGLLDGRERELGTSPVAADTDGDGLDDADEVARGTDPTDTDTDGDFLEDGLEAKIGVDPTDSFSPAWMTGVGVGFISGAGLMLVTVTQGGVFVPPTIRGVLRRVRGYRGPIPSGADVGDGGSRPDSESGTESEPGAESSFDVRSESDAEPELAARPTGETAEEVVERANVEFLPDAELVQWMLRAEGGRMRQSAIVDATGWSKAKVSRRLSAMEDDDAIVKVQVGRENLICLEGAVPELAVPRASGPSNATGPLKAAAGGQ